MSDLMPLLPLIIVVVGALTLMMLEVFFKESPTVFNVAALSTIVLAATAAVVDWILHPGAGATLMMGAVRVDHFAHFFTLLILACGAVTLISGLDYFPREHMGQGEVYSMLLFAMVGMMVLAMGTHLITLFVGVEIMSIAVYVLVGARRHAIKANEAALKYFFLGAFSSGILLFGIAMIYGMTGTAQLDAVRDYLAHPAPGHMPLLVIGLAMLVVGIGFKVAAAPFHAWTPDVYEGAPTPITGFMATAVKAASFALFLRVLSTFLPIKGEWVAVVAALSVVTMFTGNLLAFVQSNAKRMLAYSSIAHTGYLMMGLVALSASKESTAATAILYYLVAYAVTNLGAFACLTFLGKQNEKLVEIDDFAGVANKFPGVALVLAICLASLIGLPPTAGFFGKYYLFSSVIQGGYAWLAVVGILNSILSVYYYLRLVVVMYMREPRADWAGAPGLVPARVAGIACAVVVVWAGIGAFNLFEIVPGAAPLLGWAKTSVAALF